MSQPIQQRMDYHPEPDASLYKRLSPLFSRRYGTRNVDQRLNAILQRVDVDNKLVLDLGCSGGYFSFVLARTAKHIWAVDGDAQLIERNRSLAKKGDYRNITFICDRISPKLLYELPRTNVVLFLSVFHHMLTASDAYDWNSPESVTGARDIFPAIAHQTESLVFEMGYPDEGFEWCSRLPSMTPSPQAWISQMLSEHFSTVTIIPPPVYSGLLGQVRSRMSRLQLQNNLLRRSVRRLFSLDSRDARDIYICSSPVVRQPCE